jgi:NAD(P)-dependent dehydrogenase (short-subunit alcohol dehydrogenase family)
MSAPLTGSSTVGTWLDDPTGGALLRDLLAPAGLDPEVLAPARGMALHQLVVMSGGQLPQSAVDDLVRAANGGEIPESTEDTGWTEQVTAGRFAGKTVVVTGAASGIGRATASRIVREGGRVVAVDVSADRLADFAAGFGGGASAAGGEVVTVTGDITKQEDIDAIVAAAGDRIDALANVAGINDDFSPLHETSDATWDRVIGINVMLDAGKGAIVNVASEAGLRGNASGNAYTVSKHGVIGLTRSAAFMYAQQGIRVNAVAPGGVATGIPMPAHVSEVGAARLGPFQAAIPSLATAEQLAASITFLLSDDAVNINGAVLASDGGWSVQ